LFQLIVDSTHRSATSFTVTVFAPVQFPTWYSFNTHEEMVEFFGGADFNHRNARFVAVPGVCSRSDAPLALFCDGAASLTHASMPLRVTWDAISAVHADDASAVLQLVVDHTVEQRPQAALPVDLQPHPTGHPLRTRRVMLPVPPA
jgi:hypothetical protein